ncbi:hypothetical protein [Rhodoferax ferrireducens]|nr:hypothetical protein [Rhodoferax ferrireducens]
MPTLPNELRVDAGLNKANEQNVYRKFILCNNFLHEMELPLAGCVAGASAGTPLGPPRSVKASRAEATVNELSAAMSQVVVDNDSGHAH